MKSGVDKAANWRDTEIQREKEGEGGGRDGVGGSPTDVVASSCAFAAISAFACTDATDMCDVSA